jgi:hypothetical protein
LRVKPEDQVVQALREARPQGLHQRQLWARIVAVALRAGVPQFMSRMISMSIQPCATSCVRPDRRRSPCGAPAPGRRPERAAPIDSPNASGDRSPMPYVLVDKPRPHVSVITLNRPERMNAMSFDTIGPLYDALELVGADNDTWAVVLTGAGRGFCAGLDLEEHGMPPGCDGLPMSRIAIRATEFMSNVVPAMRRIPQPIVVAVNGPAYGGGLCLMLGADIRLAAESARFCSAGIRNGLTATELGVSWLLPRLVGAAHAWDILLTTREVDGRMRDSNSVPPLVEMWHGPVREAPPRTGPCKTREQIVPAVACADD